MTRWLLQMMGIGTSEAEGGASLVMTHGPRSWGVFVLLAVALLLLWAVLALYRRESDTAPPRARLALAALRALVVLCVLAVLLGPAVVFTQRRTIEPVVLVMVDESLSMAVRDRYASDPAMIPRLSAATGLDASLWQANPPTRMELARRALLEADGGSRVRDLATRGRVVVMSFSSTVRERADLPASGSSPRIVPASATTDAASSADASASGPPPLPVPPEALGDPTGQSTDLATAIREALRRQVGVPVAAIVLMTDGRSNEGEDPLIAADLAADLGVPIIAVGVGDSDRPRNIRVASVWSDPAVWKDDPFRLEASIQSSGIDAQGVSVELLETPADDAGAAAAAGKVVGRKLIQLAADAPPQTVGFEHKPSRAGRFVYAVRVAAVPPELSESDNQADTPVTVLGGKSKVLLVAGAPSWEFRLVRDLLRRDAAIDLSSWLQSAAVDVIQEGDTPLTRLPDKFEDLSAYDVIVLLDPDPRPAGNPTEMGDTWFESLRRVVQEQGTGLLYMAGPKFAGQYLTQARARPLADMLPVRIGEARLLDSQVLVRSYQTGWPVSLTAEGVDHPMLRFDSDPRANRALWDAMPPVFWSFPSGRAKPATRVLLEHSDPTLRRDDSNRPLLVAGLSGAGRVVYVGINGTWRWRRVGHDSQYFDRFWVQGVRYLTEGRLAEGKRRGRIEFDPDRPQIALGTQVRATAHLVDRLFRPLEAPSISASLRLRGAPPLPVEMRPVEGRPGSFSAVIPAAQLGPAELLIPLPTDAGAPPIQVSRSFTIVLPSLETDDPRLNLPLLAQIADRTDGKAIALDQLDQLPALIPDRRSTLDIQSKPLEIWDTGRLLLLIVILLGVEWALRKFVYRLQ